MKKIVITIPLVAPSLNMWYAGTHWSKRNKLAQEWHTAIWAICKVDKIQPITTFPVEIATTSVFRTRHKRDVDNCVPANKLAADGLVLAGILPDDTQKYVNRHVINPSQYGQKKDQTIITITVP